MRKESLIKSQKLNFIGKEIFIPIRDGKTRALIYISKNRNNQSPVFLTFTMVVS
jgi:acetyl esterase